ncbi:Arylacetamide deacetylase [Escovopsis weberi]|uniref:Arylacetamide deacetylase n=1 Tax=Escovopsis weberi TaxID=150374 RepID=A0A0M9VVX8_ESCWE|nr:Arylacetamide deacetylase [Escovopsis weberi]
MDPAPPAPSTSFWVDSTLTESCNGRSKIRVDVWTPARVAVGPRAAVICLHGGGWILGQGTDCSRWAGAVMGALDAVVFSINYRLAPYHPFPVPIEDTVDAILQIAKRACQFGIDPDHMILSGFSAGASTALSSWIILQDPGSFGYKLPFPAPQIRGLVLFYPVLDWTISRPEKRKSCSRPDLTLSKALTDLIDACYIYPCIARKERTDIRLSPGLMPGDLIQQLPPIHLCLCEYDMLLAEGQRFAARLEAQGKAHSLRVVMGEKHGWDCPPPMWPKESVAVEYGEATQAMAAWLCREHDSDNASMRSARTSRLSIPRPSALLISRSKSCET